MSLDIRFPTGDVVAITWRENVLALAEELAALGDEASADTAETGYSSPHGRLSVTDENAQTIARALDHLHNMQTDDLEGRDPDDVRDARKDINDARAGVLQRLQIAPLTYRLRSWIFNGRDESFWSFSGTYEKGGRLVPMTGEVFTILTVERQATPIEDGVILVSRED